MRSLEKRIDFINEAYGLSVELKRTFCPREVDFFVAQLDGRHIFRIICLIGYTLISKKKIVQEIFEFDPAIDKTGGFKFNLTKARIVRSARTMFQLADFSNFRIEVTSRRRDSNPVGGL